MNQLRDSGQRVGFLLVMSSSSRRTFSSGSGTNLLSDHLIEDMHFLNHPPAQSGSTMVATDLNEVDSVVPLTASPEQQTEQFCRDVIEGLSGEPKKLQSKYFYDQAGDELFQQIMACPEYYLSRCEGEIFRQQASAMAEFLHDTAGSFDLIELGAGDATKSQYLLQALADRQAAFTYMPIDISGNILSVLQSRLTQEIPGLDLQPFQGEYFDMLREATCASTRPKVVMFLGGNIGNMEVAEAQQFCEMLRSYLNPGDLVLIGFDLKKQPSVILDAYHDHLGLTSQFNLNLLARINRELNADFNLPYFMHYPCYDPITGSCRSYLISQKDQTVRIGDQIITFTENEPIFMEVSQKFSTQEIDVLSENAGFLPVHRRYDSKRWFIDDFWKAI